MSLTLLGHATHYCESWYEQYIFHMAVKQPNETVDWYLLRLSHLVELCTFGNLHKEILRDRLVLGCQDKGTWARFFRERDYNRSKALETLQVSETTEGQLKYIAGEDKPSINAANNEKQG